MESAIIQGIDSSYEPSGTFTSDYADYCKRKGFRPMYLHQIRANLQQQSQKDASKDPLDKGNVLPLTASITAGSNGLPDKTMTMPDQSDTPNNVNNNTYNNTYNNSNNNAYNNTYNNSNNNTTNPTTNPTSGSGSGNNNSTNNPDSKPSSASVKRMGLSYAAMDYIKTSISGGKGFDPSAGLQFRTPSIQLEYLDEIDSDEILTKISVRGWNLLPGTIEAMYVCLPSAMTLSTLSLWNCGLDDTAFNVLAACLLHCNIVNFQCDQNPVLDSLYAQLFSDLSPIKYVTLRSNSISDTGMEAICAALKFNRTVVTLNLYDNNITDKAMESLSEALKYNQTLNSLSLAKNQIKDEGVKQLTKAFVKVASNAEEIANRRKHFTEMEKRKKDWEEDQTKRAGKPGVKNPSPGRPGSSLKKEQAKTSSNSDLKSPGKKGSVAAAVKQPAAAGKKPGPAAANSTATQAAPPNPPADSNKKGEPRQRSGDAKNKEKEKKAPANVASKVPPASSSSSSKKKEEAQELDEFELFLLEISLEINGVSYLLGNRSLNSLNLAFNLITESGLQYLQDAIQDQESPDGETHDGLYKIPLVGNPGEKSNSSILNTINNILLSRNPFIEDSQANHRDSTSLPGVGNEENAPEQ